MGKTRALVLAAGLGTRMKSDLPKVLHGIAGRPMLWYVLDALRSAGAEKIGLVVGHGRKRVEEEFRADDVEFILQEKQKGTGHAVMTAADFIRAGDEDLLVTPGDVPLVDEGVLEGLLRFHGEIGSEAALLSMKVDDPAGYGRVLRDGDKVVAVREHRDADEREREIREVNTGIYVFKPGVLLEEIERLDTDNAQGEFYLTDVFENMAGDGRRAGVLCLEGESYRGAGINNRAELAAAEERIYMKAARSLMLEGVTIHRPETVTVDPTVTAGADTEIYPCSVIERDARIGGGCRIGPFAMVEEGARVEDGAVLGPFETVRAGDKPKRGKE